MDKRTITIHATNTSERRVAVMSSIPRKGEMLHFYSEICQMNKTFKVTDIKYIGNEDLRQWAVLVYVEMMIQ